MLRERLAFYRDLKSIEVNLVRASNRLVLPALRKVLDSRSVLYDFGNLDEAVVVTLT